jgi:glycine cleavage system H protein
LSPDDRKYTIEHEWIKVEDAATGQARAGITDYAQDQLGDIVYFDLPKAGDTITHHGKMGEVESVKAVSDLFSPVSGQVLEVNARLIDHPELTNQDPFGEGWLVLLALSDATELDSLMSADEYEAFIVGL